MKTNNDTIRDNLTVFALSMLVIVPVAAWHGFVATKLWGWFIVPFGVAQIGIFHAAGVSLILGFMSGVSSMSGRLTGLEKKEGVWEAFGVNMFRTTVFPALFLLFGWIYFLLAF